MEQLEEANGRRAQLEATLKRETAEWQSLQERMKSQLEATDAALKKLTGNRSEVANQIAAPDQTTYETLRRQKGGTAVAIVSQRTCQACRVGLTPSQEQRARQGVEIITCHSCGRILYVPLS
jgi:predicted  nucleic acid-binding Zn-ribbon protein